MKGQKKIIGKTIISVEGYGCSSSTNYLIAKLSDGTEIEISDITIKREKPFKKQIGDIGIKVGKLLRRKN